jgi:GT2 family glycosyltransferase
MSIKKQPIVGIIILTYNAESYIADCLDSILNNNYSTILCIVVDNDSKDKTIDIVQKYYPSVYIIKNSKNLGFAAGNNVGIKYLLLKNNISYILILNPDTLADKHLISELVKVMETNPSIAVSGPIITYSHRSNIIWFAGGNYNNLFCYTKHPYMDTYLDQDKIISKKTDFITGACMLIRTSVLQKAGLFSEKYFMYFEDVDFCQKVQNNSLLCYLLAKPLLAHIVSSSSGKPGTNQLTPFRAYYLARNPFIFIKNNVSGFHKITNYIGQFVIRLPYYGLHMVKLGDLKSLLSYLRGMRDGLLY